MKATPTLVDTCIRVIVNFRLELLQGIQPIPVGEKRLAHLPLIIDLGFCFITYALNSTKSAPDIQNKFDERDVIVITIAPCYKPLESSNAAFTFKTISLFQLVFLSAQWNCRNLYNKVIGTSATSAEETHELGKSSIRDNLVLHLKLLFLASWEVGRSI